MTESARDAAVVSQPARRGSRGESRAGLVYGLTAYTMWGIFPIYFRFVANVPPPVVLCHRILWSALFMGLVVSIRKEWNPIGQVLRSRRSLLLLCTGAVLIALNWLIFIYAVGSKQVLQASLGYFINPLLSIALGLVFLGERLRTLQWVAVGIAALGLLNMTIRGSGLPWIAVSLACSFGLYGLVRKKLDINSLHGLLIESAILVPVALALLPFLPGARTSPGMFGILSLSGIITAVPLLFFGAALRRLKLSTIGFLQYIGPTLQFLVAVCLFHEALDRAKLVSFALCWVAIAVYTADSFWNRYPQELADEPE